MPGLATLPSASQTILRRQDLAAKVVGILGPCLLEVLDKPLTSTGSVIARLAKVWISTRRSQQLWLQGEAVETVNFRWQLPWC